jgi:hypothetical protein
MSDCCLTPIQQFIRYIMAETSYFSMRWWWDPLCSRSTRWVFFIVLAYWNNSPQIDMSLHSDSLFWLWANQSLILLLNAACLTKKQQILISVFGLTRPAFERSSTKYTSSSSHKCNLFSPWYNCTHHHHLIKCNLFSPWYNCTHHHHLTNVTCSHHDITVHIIIISQM